MEQLGTQLEAIGLVSVYLLMILAMLSPLLYLALLIALPIWRLIDYLAERRSESAEENPQKQPGPINPRGRPRPPVA
jgi:hypothetical protein